MKLTDKPGEWTAMGFWQDAAKPVQVQRAQEAFHQINHRIDGGETFSSREVESILRDAGCGSVAWCATPPLPDDGARVPLPARYQLREYDGRMLRFDTETGLLWYLTDGVRDVWVWKLIEDEWPVGATPAQPAAKERLT